MNASEQFLKDNKIVPFISFKDGQSHRIRIYKDKLDTITDKNGVLIDGVSYLVMEGGTAKKFFTKSISLISKLASFVGKETDVLIQMKSVKDAGGYKSVYDVKAVTPETEQMAEEPPNIGEDFGEGEIPVIEDEPNTENSQAAEEIPF